MKNKLVMQKIVKDIKKYYKYILYSAKSELKSEVANSYLNWFWWILNPLFFMLIYTFISVVVFKSRQEYFPIFVFIGLSAWDFFNRIVTSSVRLIKANNAVVSKVYIPKYMFIIQKILVNGFKMLLSFALVVIMMIFWKVPFTFEILFLIPYLIALFFISFSFGTIMMHFGVFIEDLSNVMTVALRLMFYMSGIFYSLENNVPKPYNEILLTLNPVAFIINELRKVLLYNEIANIGILVVWLMISLVMSFIAIKIIYKYENGYVKVS